MVLVFILFFDESSEFGKQLLKMRLEVGIRATTRERFLQKICFAF